MIIDHVALEVDDLDERVLRLEAAGLRVLRHGTRYSTGQRIVMMGDGTGNKLELIEAEPAGTADGPLEVERPGTPEAEDPAGRADAAVGSARPQGPVFAHLALRSDDADAAHRMLRSAGYSSLSEPHDLAAARARSALLDSGDGMLVQVVSYAEDSPDAVTWEQDPQGSAVAPADAGSHRHRSGAPPAGESR